MSSEKTRYNTLFLFFLMFFIVYSVILCSKGGAVMSDFTNRIDALLVERTLRRVDICRATGISESTIRTWITRDAMPSAEAAFKVAQYFGVTVEYLLTGQNLEDAPQLYLSPEENEIIDIYRSLDKKSKNVLVGMAQLLERER